MSHRKIEKASQPTHPPDDTPQQGSQKSRNRSGLKQSNSKKT